MAAPSSPTVVSSRRIVVWFMRARPFFLLVELVIRKAREIADELVDVDKAGKLFGVSVEAAKAGGE